MKIPFNETFTDNGETLMRRCGYAKQIDKRLSKISYFKRLGSQHFPKFHVYINTEEPFELDIHLDHKSHTYEGQAMHGGDYDSQQVRAEALYLWNTVREQAGRGESNMSGYKELDMNNEEDKPSLWKSIFGKKGE